MKALYADFAGADDAIAAATQLRASGFALLDALTPYPLEPLVKLVGASSAGIRVPMAVVGFGAAAALFGLETWSAVVAYRFDSGGRPAFSWPVFLLSPFEVGILAAAIAGVAAFLIRAGLPRLNHPTFDVPGHEGATQDRFVLVVDAEDVATLNGLRALLFDAGARSVAEGNR